ncbi:kinase-like domain-containing protein [Mycena pura]|uniref:Kinase-like domain-containing protein n=1 Tax=Mycena pura TaxID=153505 RepID=A0AAD6VEM4_9AGAR|nr:kinase-like domain-containing protein [Mycena pura]
MSDSDFSDSFASDVDLFGFGDDEDYESSAAYSIGGLCPIKLGDVLGTPPRYRVISKLGFGSFSTVWLARDRVLSRTVALKVVKAEQTGQSRELGILQRLVVPASAPSKNPCAIQLLDSFETTSANGVHQVFVTELTVHLLDQPWICSRFRPRVTKDVLRQTVEALAFIHSRGIAHGDLHPANFGLAVPDFDQFSDAAIWEMTDVPETWPLVPTCDVDLNSFPPYICDAMDLGAFLLQYLPKAAAPPYSVRILDFGSAYLVDGSPSPQYKTPAYYSAPEIAFSRASLGKEAYAPWDQRSDIWSLAVTFHNLVGAQGIYDESLMGVTANDIPYFMASLCGEMPDAWRDYIASHEPPSDRTHEDADEIWKEKEEQFAAMGVDDPPGLVKLMRRMLVLDPAKRPTAAELLDDPYFVGKGDKD